MQNWSVKTTTETENLRGICWEEVVAQPVNNGAIIIGAVNETKDDVSFLSLGSHEKSPFKRASFYKYQFLFCALNRLHKS